MEQNLPVIVKKTWSLVRVVFFMLKKGIISKRKFFLNLNMIMKHGKISSNAFPNTLPGEYEFSCSSTPPYPFSLFSTNKKHKNKRRHRLSTQNPQLAVDDSDDIMVDDAVYKVLNMLTASPPLPGFGNTPMVEQLRITDSPFPLTHFGEDGHVDEAAEKFIMRFYNDRKREN